MTPERWKQVDRLLQEALEREAAITQRANSTAWRACQFNRGAAVRQRGERSPRAWTEIGASCRKLAINYWPPGSSMPKSFADRSMGAG